MICPRCGIAVVGACAICQHCSFNLALLAGDDDRHCKQCDCCLDNRPTIEIGNLTAGRYCYTCAKRVVADIEKTLAAKAEAVFAEEYAIYTNLADTYSQWERRRNEFAWNQKKTRMLWALGIAIALAMVGGWIFSIFILFYFFMFFFTTGQGDYSEFDKVNPTPPKPTRPYLKRPTVTHRPLHSENFSSTRMSRAEIIERDRNSCQWCGITGPRSAFEVHHVLPRAKGGNDDPSNLITLCLECHRKESWYGHVHKYGNNRA